MRLATPGYKALRGAFADSDDYDPWGNAMGWFFAVADVIWYETAEEIPAAWQYRHGPGCSGVRPDESWESEQILYLIGQGDVTDDDLITFGDVLDRYTNVLRLAGRDY